jgi:hypothetical protein
MEYRGKYYLVFRSTPNGWRWAVDLDAHTVESGRTATQKEAMNAAERRIDQALAPKQQKSSSPVFQRNAGGPGTKTVWIYVNTSKQVGDIDHLEVFGDREAADRWLEENDPEGIAFGYEVQE